MKILWFNTTAFGSEKIKTTGSWTFPLAQALMDRLEIVNIVVSKSCSSTQCTSVDKIKQYILPYPGTKLYGHVASESFRVDIKDIIQKEVPDILHIWGTESFWANVIVSENYCIPVLLEIQGLIFSYYYHYYGGLRTSDILQAIHLKEVIMPWRTLFYKKEIFRKRGAYEKKMIACVDNIDYQSDWTKNQIENLNPNASFFKTNIVLRQAFYSAEPWYYSMTENPVLFTTASGAIPYKGIHIALNALAELKKNYPFIKLRIAGQMLIGEKLIDGFSLYLQALLKKLDIEQNVEYLGPLDENELVKELQNCSVCIIPSFVETYCLAFAEAMMVGTPTVAAYAGAMPELAIDGKEALFYSPLDFINCASKVKLLIENETLSVEMSKACRKRRLIENNIENIVTNQIKIYQTIISNIR